MKLAAGVLAACVASSAALSDHESWMRTSGTSYKTSEEQMARKAIFDLNVRGIAAHNAKDLGWTMAVNEFADMTSDEFAARYIGGWRGPSKMVNPVATEHLFGNQSLPTSVDWSQKGAVTPIKNQEQCGSCWAFSTTGSVEGITYIKTGTLPSLSEQQLVDCSSAEGNQGCNGGLMDQAFEYIVKNGGLCSETAYPYKAATDSCTSSTCKSVATISGHTDVPVDNENALMSAVAGQPVSIAIEADQMSFQFYSTGVMTAACGTNLDHGVLVVGYGTQSGTDFWKVKNSWGTTWGEAGYILLGRGKAFAPKGQCGMLSVPSYPTKN